MRPSTPSAALDRFNRHARVWLRRGRRRLTRWWTTWAPRATRPSAVASHPARAASSHREWPAPAASLAAGAALVAWIVAEGLMLRAVLPVQLAYLLLGIGLVARPLLSVWPAFAAKQRASANAAARDPGGLHGAG